MYVAAFEQVQNMVTEAVVAAAAPCDSLVDKFAAIIDALTEVSKNDASLIGFVVGVSAEARRHPELSDAIRPLRKEWAIFFQQLCENAVARGEVGSEMTARTLQDLFDVMISGLARFAYVINDREREDAVIDGLKRFVAAAVS
jgi:AcrR family transcriptional regulator